MWGLEKFAALSDGSIIENPRHLRKTEERLKPGQREPPKEKGSRNRGEGLGGSWRSSTPRFATSGWTSCTKQSRKLVNTYSLIAVEELNIKGMVIIIFCAKAALIMPSCGREFISCLNKAEKPRTKFWAIKVNPSTALSVAETAAGCGTTDLKNSSVWVHCCRYCGLTLDRGRERCPNILKRALALEAA